MSFWRAGLLFLLVSLPTQALQPQLSTSLVGSRFTYTVRKGDSLTGVGARFGIDATVLAKLNGLKPRARLKPSQMLLVENRHVVPNAVADGILINIPQRMLFLFKEGTLLGHYPVAVGRPDWQTLIGNFNVLSKEQDKVWIVPKSIQEEMRREGKPVKKRVPPGPENPLGKYWIRVTPDCGIHGTIFPTSIYTFQTHGCVRLLPADIHELYTQVPVGTPITIIYEPVLLARLPAGGVFLEVHADVYERAEEPVTTVERLTEGNVLHSVLDWKTVKEVIKQQQGLAQEVGVAPASEVPAKAQ
jgi:L,D-transpeptidase ErfK/SrfK